MNRKQFSLLLVLVVVVGLSGLVLYKHNRSSWQAESSGMGQKLLGDLAVNDVMSIGVSQGTNHVDLVKKDGLWCVQQRDYYPADYSQISDFLLKAADLKIIQSEPVGPSQWERLGLAPEGTASNSMVAVDFRDKGGKAMRTLLLGKPYVKQSARNNAEEPMDASAADGRYVRVGTNSPTVALVAETFSSLEPRAESWLDKDFVKIEKPRLLEVVFPAVTNSWKVSRENADGAAWRLEGASTNENLDAASASAFGSALSAPAFSDVLPLTSKPEQVGLDKPVVLKVETFDAFSYTFNIGTRSNSVYPVTVQVTAQLPAKRIAQANERAEEKARLDKEFEEEQAKQQAKLAREKALGKRTYLVANWTLEPLLKTRSQLLAVKKPAGTNAASAGGEPVEGEMPGDGGPATHSPQD